MSLTINIKHKLLGHILECLCGWVPVGVQRSGRCELRGCRLHGLRSAGTGTLALPRSLLHPWSTREGRRNEFIHRGPNALKFCHLWHNDYGINAWVSARIYKMRTHESRSERSVHSQVLRIRLPIWITIHNAPFFTFQMPDLEGWFERALRSQRVKF